MSQARILALLKYHSGGLTAKEIHEALGLGNCYAQLKKLERAGDIIVVLPTGKAFRWKLNE